MFGLWLCRCGCECFIYCYYHGAYRVCVSVWILRNQRSMLNVCRVDLAPTYDACVCVYLWIWVCECSINCGFGCVTSTLTGCDVWVWIYIYSLFFVEYKLNLSMYVSRGIIALLDSRLSVSINCIYNIKNSSTVKTKVYNHVPPLYILFVLSICRNLIINSLFVLLHMFILYSSFIVCVQNLDNSTWGDSISLSIRDDTQSRHYYMFVQNAKP